MAQPVAVSLLLKTASDLAFSHNRNTQIEYLRHVFNAALKDVLQGAYHPGVKWLLPEGEITYVPAENTQDYDSKFYREHKKLYVFCKGGADGLPQSKRLRMFVQLLEAVHPNDAVMLMAMKDKYLPYPGLDYDLIREAFPDLLPVKNEVIFSDKEPVEDTKPDPELPSNLDNMSKEELEAFFKNKFGQAIPEPEPKKKTGPKTEDKTNKGKKWYNNGTEAFLVLPEEAEKNGWVSGRLPKK